MSRSNRTIHLLRAPEKQRPWKRKALWKVEERQRNKKHILHRMSKCPSSSLLTHPLYITNIYVLGKLVRVAPASGRLQIERPIKYKPMNFFKKQRYRFITVKFQNKIEKTENSKSFLGAESYSSSLFSINIGRQGSNTFKFLN